MILALLLVIASSLSWAHKSSLPHDHSQCQALLKPSLDSSGGKVKSNPLLAHWQVANDWLPTVEKAFDAFSEEEKSDFAPILDAVKSALTKHQKQFENEHNWKKLDVARHMLILKSIAEFDPQKPKFSLYKIKRSIEGRHSLREYILCSE